MFICLRYNRVKFETKFNASKVNYQLINKTM